MADNPDEFVEAQHAETGNRASFPRFAFETVWSHLGWEEADPVAVAVAEAVGSEQTDLSKFTKPQLVGIGAEMGLVLDEKDLKDDLIAAIEAHAKGSPVGQSEEE